MELVDIAHITALHVLELMIHVLLVQLEKSFSMVLVMINAHILWLVESVHSIVLQDFTKLTLTNVKDAILHVLPVMLFLKIVLLAHLDSLIKEDV